MNELRFLRSATVALVAATLLGGCATEPEDAAPTTSDPTASPAPTQTPSPPPTPDPEPEAVSLPTDCEEALPLSLLHELYDGDTRIVSIPEAAEGLRENTLEYGFGPIAGEALENAEQSIQCVWGYPNSDFALQVYAAILAPETRSELIAALDDSVFEREDEGDTVVFSDYTETGVAPFRKTYFFRGDLWVAEMSTGPQQAIAGREFFDRLTS